MKTLVLWLLPLGILLWALHFFPETIRHSSGQYYILSVSWWSLAKLGAIFFALYLLPGVVILAKRAPTRSRAASLSANRILLAFALGMTAHVFALLLQKYLHFPYRPVVVLGCLGLGYGALYGLLDFLPVAELLKEEPIAPWRAEDKGMVIFLLGLGLLLGLEMTLRGRASSLSLSGDGYPHLINTLGTMVDGPMPDGLPFYSTFILNIHPMAFHALLAGLKTVTPGLLYIDLIRYFSVPMVPVFLACMYGFFSFLARDRVVGAVAAFVSLFISGGGLSLGIPIVYFPWYWSIAWCLSAGVFYILLKSELRFPSLGLAAGVCFGVGVLLHPFFAFRMGMILAFFLPLELLRRLASGEPSAPLWRNALLFGVGMLLPIGMWLVPMLLRHAWEETYSYDYILRNFSSLAPDGVAYLKTIRGMGFHFRDLWTWSLGNAGLLPTLMAPLGLWAVFRRPRGPEASLLLAWPLAMASAVLLGYLPNPYRYFEYFFFGLLALAAFGWSWVLSIGGTAWRRYALVFLLSLALLSLGRDFWPKYRLVLNLYGRTSLKPTDIQAVESWADRYLQAKAAGQLDVQFGSYRGYLWSRQKKIWDIYLKTQRPKPVGP